MTLISAGGGSVNWENRRRMTQGRIVESPQRKVRDVCWGGGVGLGGGGRGEFTGKKDKLQPYPRRLAPKARLRKAWRGWGGKKSGGERPLFKGTRDFSQTGELAGVRMFRDKKKKAKKKKQGQQTGRRDREMKAKSERRQAWTWKVVPLSHHWVVKRVPGGRELSRYRTQKRRKCGVEGGKERRKG